MLDSRPIELQRLHDWLDQPIRDLGYELYDLEVLWYKGKRVLRLTIDRDQGIQLEDCVDVDRVTQKILDQQDPICEAYTLEVSSPGVFRSLTLPGHFQRFSGERIRIRLHQQIQGIRNAVGLLAESSEKGILFVPENQDPGEVFIDYPSISRANLEPVLI